MTNQRKINVANRLIQVSNNLLSPEMYFKNRARRRDLSGYYKEFYHLGSAFPQVPGNLALASKLDKRISRSCPACVSPDNMKIYIESAIRFIEQYGAKLEVMVEQIDNPIKSVHDLKPTNR